MKGLKYQLKNMRRDTMCILTFLLPIVVGIAISLISGVSVQTINETSFGILKNDLSNETVAWLQLNGSVTPYETVDELQKAVNNPSTQMIGVLKADNSIRTILSGDELAVNKVIADTLPRLYDSREEKEVYNRTIVSVSNDNDSLQSLLIAITLVTAMFMGCTFNAMNIISEKEDGVAYINMVLPITTKEYIVQKVLLGCIGSFLSTILTAFFCMQIELALVIPFVIMIVLSVYIAALIGLFIGYFAEGLMVGIVYIKAIMIGFLAPPIFFYLMVPADTILFPFSYLLPSSATFYGLMDLRSGQTNRIWLFSMILLAHAVGWSVVYMLIKNRKYR